MSNQVKDINSTFNKEELSARHPAIINTLTYTPMDVEIALSDGTIVRLDFVQISYVDMAKIKRTADIKIDLMDKINILYKEHNKLAILGCIYPIFTIEIRGVEIEIKLNKFSEVGTNLDKYILKSFITGIDFKDNYNCTVKELVIQNKIAIYSLGSNKQLKVTGIENVTEFTSKNFQHILYNAEKYNNGELRFKYLKYMYLVNELFDSIHSIVFEDTCSITDLQQRILENFTELQEITFQSWANPSLENHRNITFDNLSLGFKLKIVGNDKVVSTYRHGKHDYIKIKFNDKQ